MSHEDRDAAAVAEVQRWETSGGHWRVVRQVGQDLVVELLTCDARERMGEVRGGAGLASYLDGRDSDED
ncbi:MAG: hypothetical protein ACTHMZ_07045 [Actinomycetes bacterium]